MQDMSVDEKTMFTKVLKDGDVNIAKETVREMGFEKISEMRADLRESLLSRLAERFKVR